MKYNVTKCDWCGTIVEGDASTWTERKGQIPLLVRDAVEDKKYFKPSGLQMLQFCCDKCNQSHKSVSTVADEAAQKAWISEYNQRHV